MMNNIVPIWNGRSRITIQSRGVFNQSRFTLTVLAVITFLGYYTLVDFDNVDDNLEFGAHGIHTKVTACMRMVPIDSRAPTQLSERAKKMSTVLF